jgi:hypothetical protein
MVKTKAKRMQEHKEKETKSTRVIDTPEGKRNAAESVHAVKNPEIRTPLRLQYANDIHGSTDMQSRQQSKEFSFFRHDRGNPDASVYTPKMTVTQHAPYQCATPIKQCTHMPQSSGRNANIQKPKTPRDGAKRPKFMINDPSKIASDGKLPI